MADRPPFQFDVTTTLAERGRIPHGTTRVERGILSALLDLDLPRCAFVRFDPVRQTFVAAAPDTVRAALTKPVARDIRRQVAAGHRVQRLGKSIEAAVRQRIRAPLRDGAARLTQRFAPPAFDTGGRFVSVGECRFGLARLDAICRRSRAAFVTTVFDVLPLAHARAGQPDRAAASMLRDFDILIGGASHLFSISRATAADIREYAGLRGLAPPEPDVIPMGHTLPVDGATGDPPADLRPNGFVLTVGDVVQRKNHALLVRVWRSLTHHRTAPVPPLVIAGRVTEEARHLIGEVRSDPALRDNIMILPDMDDAALAWLYRNCRFTVFPSRLEGYGLPVGESLAFGKLCIASNTSAIPAAGQGRAIHLDPDDEAAWRAEIEPLLDDDDALAQITGKRLAGYRPITWHDTAMHILSALDSLEHC